MTQVLHASEIPPHPPTTLRDAGSGPAAEGSGAGRPPGGFRPRFHFPPSKTQILQERARGTSRISRFFPAPLGRNFVRHPTRARARARARTHARALGAPSCFCTHPKLVKRSSRLRGCDRSSSAIISANRRRKRSHGRLDRVQKILSSKKTNSQGSYFCWHRSCGSGCSPGDSCCHLGGLCDNSGGLCFSPGGLYWSPGGLG